MLRTQSEQSIEESMDPPSFTRKILREELKISENELNKYQKILNEKALKITQKLSKEEDEDEQQIQASGEKRVLPIKDHDENEEEVKEVPQDEE